MTSCRVPKFIDMYLVGDTGQHSALLSFAFNGARFEVLAASPNDGNGGDALVPLGYDFPRSIEAFFLPSLSNANAEQARGRLKEQFAGLIADACTETMQRLVPTAIPYTHTLQESLYPPTHILQILTDSRQGTRLLWCRILDHYSRIPDRHPPVPKSWLHGIGFGSPFDLALTTGVPVFDASQVILVSHIHGLAWGVTVQGEQMLLKMSRENDDGIELAVELHTCLIIRDTSLQKLRGVVVSHRGIIGILLDRQHNHH